jgi:hypothetical protein
MDPVEEEWTALFAKPSKRPKGIARRAQESRPIAQSTRRQLRTGETKTEQLNVKVRKTFKAQIIRLAAAYKVSQSDLIEMAVEKLAASEGTEA